MSAPSSTIALPSLADIQRYLALLYPDPPSDAWLVVSWADGQGGFPSQWFRASAMDDAAVLLAQYAAHFEVYIGLGLHNPALLPTGSMRGQSIDVVAIPGLWIEFDHSAGVHRTTKRLPSPADLAIFLAGCPFQFSLVVDSTGGTHGYLLFKEAWLLDTPTEWQRAVALMQHFQRAIQVEAGKQGWHIDSTADLARVLRPSGTLNHKHSTPQLVTILEDNPIRYSPLELENAPWLDTTPLMYTPPPGTAGFSGRPADLTVITDHCAWLQHCWDDAHDLPEPEWYAMLGIVGRCIDGENAAQAWSQPYPRSSAQETRKKLHHALLDAGPRTCASIRAHLDGEPYCAVCPSWGTIKSPIVLGMPKAVLWVTPPPAPGATRGTMPPLPSPAASPNAHPIIFSFDQLTAKPAYWLWWPYLPHGTLVMLDGDPGLGKSLLSVTLAAILSRGWQLPDQQGGLTWTAGEPCDTILIAGEDSLTQTILPRLQRADADTRRIHSFTMWTDAQGAEQVFTLKDIPMLEEALLLHPEVRLVVIDPIQAHLGDIDMHRANEVRAVLAPLSRLAERHGVTMCCIRHPAKPGQGGGKAIYRGLGSIDFVGAARSVLFVEGHPVDPAGKVLLAQTKNNLDRIGRTQIFTKDDGLFAWAGVTRLSGEMIGASGQQSQEGRLFLEIFCWLENRLKGGLAWPETDIMLELTNEGYKERTAKTVKKALGVISRKEPAGHWTWRLPDLDMRNPPP